MSSVFLSLEEEKAAGKTKTLSFPATLTLIRKR